jgi:hypothetical protein
MRRNISWIAVVALAGLMTALAVAGAVAAKNGGVPFKGSYSGTCTPVSFSFPFAQVDCLASGHATHVGNSSEDSLITANLLSGTTTGTVTLTAANGDEIFLSTSGTSSPLGGGVNAISGTQTVFGGTGRFEGASGSFTVAGSINTVTESISYTLDGSISY